jgi:hypothetical protein
MKWLHKHKRKTETVLWLGIKKFAWGKLDAKFVWSEKIAASDDGNLLVDFTKPLKNKHLLVILSDDLADIHTVVAETDPKSAEADLMERLKELYPGKLDDYGIDWHIVSQSKHRSVYSVLAVPALILKKIGEATHRNSLKIDRVITKSQIALEMINDPEPVILVGGKTKAWIAAGWKRQVLQFDHQNPIYTGVENLVSWAQGEIDLKITKAYMTNGHKDEGKQLHKEFGLGVEEKIIEFGLEDKSPEIKSDPERNDPEEQMAEAEKSDTIASVKTPRVIDIRPVAPKPPLKVEKGQQYMNGDTIQSNKKANAKIYLVLVTILVVLLGIVLGGVLVYRSALNSKHQPEIIEPESTPTVKPVNTPETDSQTSQEATPEGENKGPQNTPSPSPASEVKINKTKLKVRVLNGSGVPGSAGKMETVLKAAGYKSITAGNADNFDFETTQISVKSGQDELLSTIKQDLKGKYNIGQADTDLAAKSEYDAVITVGKE